MGGSLELVVEGLELRLATVPPAERELDQAIGEPELEPLDDELEAAAHEAARQAALRG